MANKVATPDMLNAIRNEASDAYRAAVPEATALNLAEVGNPIMNYSAVKNEFVSALVNKIIYTLVYRKTWKSPLTLLKKDPTPLGFDIEEANVNPATEKEYDGTATGMADLLQPTPPDVASAYYRLNRQSKYKVTINNRQLTNAFTSWNALENFIAAIVDSLYNANTIDEFTYTKQLVTDAIAANQMQTVAVPTPVDEASARGFSQQLRGLSMAFTFPSTAYNNYKLMGGTGNDRVTFSAQQDQVILVTSAVVAAVDVQWMAAAFNLSYADYMARQIVVDNFGTSKALAVIADKRAFQIHEKMRQFAEFFNPSSLSWQYYYHAWDIMSLSPFHNCVALVAA